VEKLSWMFELLDKMSGPADKIAKSLKKLDPALKTTGGQSSLFSRIIGGIGQTFGPKASGAVLRFASAAFNLGGKLGILSPAFKALGSVGAVAGKGLLLAGTAMIGIGLAAATAVGGLAIAGGRYVASALVFKEDSLTAFEAILGSKSAADEVMAQATKFAAKTPFKTSEVVDMAKSLLTRGFKGNELDTLMKGVGDVGALLGAEKMDSVINALGKMRANGKMTGETLQMLADAGINSQLVFASLGKQLGKSKDEIEKLMAAGKITDAQGIKAAMDAIAKGLSGGELGGAMDKKSKTLSGLLSTLESVPEELVFSANMSAAIEPIKKFIELITTAMSPDSANGKRVIAMLEEVGKAVGEIFGEMNGGDVAGTFAAILNVVEPLFKAFVAFGKGAFKGIVAVLTPIIKAFEKFGKQPGGIESLTLAMASMGELVGASLAVLVVVVGAVVGALLGLITRASAIISWLWELAGEIVSFFENVDWAALGLMIVEGLIIGLAAMAGPLGMAVTGLGDIVKDAFTGNLQIGSPSKVTDGYGVDTGQGYINGLQRSGIGAALDGMLNMPASMKLPNVTGGNVSGGQTNDTGQTTGLFGSLASLLPFPTGAMGLAGMVSTALPALPGMPGQAGLPGLAGAAGMPGSSGAPGLPGSSGAPGLPGPGGTAGAPGLPGPGGTAGEPGAPGGASASPDSSSFFARLAGAITPFAPGAGIAAPAAAAFGAAPTFTGVAASAAIGAPPSVPGVPPAPPGIPPVAATPPSGTEPGLFDNLIAALSMGPAAQAASLASNAIQPASANGPVPGSANMKSGDQNVNVAAPQVIINVHGAENAEAAGKEAAGSFMSQIGSALKKLGSERGG